MGVRVRSIDEAATACGCTPGLVLEATEIDVEAVPVLDQRGAKTQATDHADAVGGGDRVEEHHEHVLQQLLEPLGVLRGLLLVLLQRLAGCDAGPLHVLPVDPRSQGPTPALDPSRATPRTSMHTATKKHCTHTLASPASTL